MSEQTPWAALCAENKRLTGELSDAQERHREALKMLSRADGDFAKVMDERDQLTATVARLREALKKAERAFLEFTANARELRTIHGQTIGSESWRLDFIGHQKGVVMDAFALAATPPPAVVPLACPECGGTGGVDSGGATPLGSPIMLPCPSCQVAHPQAAPKEPQL